MSRVTELMDLIVQGKNAEASDVLNNELLSRTYEAIGELRPHIAADYFKSVVGEPELDDEEQTISPEEDETNEAD